MIYQRGDRRVRRVLRLFQPLLGFSGASAFSVCSAVKFKDIAIPLKKSTVPCAAVYFKNCPASCDGLALMTERDYKMLDDNVSRYAVNGVTELAEKRNFATCQFKIHSRVSETIV